MEPMLFRNTKSKFFNDGDAIQHLVTLEQAIKLKQLGLDLEYKHYFLKSKDGKIQVLSKSDFSIIRRNYTNAYFLPELHQVQEWLRNCKELHVLPRLENVNKPDYVCIITLMHKESIRITDDGKYFLTYEQALSAGISKALELLGKEEKE